ncbi:hypothetical protein COLO4_22628 [Corchorus olitorius]|uniref:F-box domain-containing protein n=1 Tax=Corchorus olitorius TaxID=93759 RepID=A0A1R3IKZ9_9ROSI|nr:hypothetical protein COLO4_22628 [Corchorus olitorius]
MEIPEPILMDILSKLPVKSLKCFKCVCKSWSFSFQTSDFVTKHYQNNLQNNNPNLLLEFLDDKTHDGYFVLLSIEKVENVLIEENIQFPSLSNSGDLPVVAGSCNGILCLLNAINVALWNASTREFKSIPPSTAKRPTNVQSPMSHCVGFGFDSITDDYKVDRFVTSHFKDIGAELHSNWVSQVELHSLKSDSWTEVPSVPLL